MSYPVIHAPAGTTVYIPFTSYSGSSGASITLTGLAFTDIEIYKNGSVTQRSSDAGYALLDTDGIDFDGITGLHGFSIDLNDNTDAGFYAAGSWYWVIVSTVTVDGQTVSFIAAMIRIVAAEGTAGTPAVDVTRISNDATAADNLEAAADGTGFNLGGGAVVAASVTGAAGSVTGAVGSVTGNVGGNVTGSVGSVATGGITAASLAADALTAAKVAADVGTEIATAVWASATRLLTAGTNIVLAKGTGVTGFNDLDAAGIRAALGMSAANMDTQLGLLATASSLATVAGYLDTEMAAALAILQKLDTSIELDGAVYRFTANALELGPTGSPPSAAAIASQVRVELTTELGRIDTTVSSRATPAQVATEMADALNTDIVADSVPADGSRGSVSQLVYLIAQFLMERSVTGTTMTVRKADGSSTLMTFTLGDASSPTSITRAS